MPVTIKVNGETNSLVHKGSNATSIATLPDVCKTPTPGGPVPMPYPNISQAPTLAKGTTTVKADGMMAAIKGSEFSLSNGDNAGVAGGVKSSTFMKESTWILYSFDVKLDGKNACRLTDKKFQNHENTVNLAGALQPIVGLQDWEAALLCEIFCACLGASKANKKERPMPDLTSIEEDPDFDPYEKPDPFGNQRCVEKELRQANHPTITPEQAYDMRTSPPTAVPGAQRGGRGTRRPDITVLGAPGAAAGSNITAIVEMKFPGDSWRKGQKAAYERIATENNPDAKVVELDQKKCNCAGK